MNLLSLNTISLTLANKKILSDISIDLAGGEFVGLIGPNGAGKSSLLKIAAGLIASHQGQAAVLHKNSLSPLQKIAAEKRAKIMAYLAQHESPAWPISVKNIVALGRSPWAKGLSLSEQDEAIVTHALKLTDVFELADRPVNELSGGELQRALLARVFAGEPQIILADEPIAALDVYHQLHIMELLAAHAQNGGAVMAALHDLSLAARFCTKLVLIHKGELIAQGSPVEVLTPQNLADVYGISAHVDCREDGVVIIPRERIN